MLSEVTVRTAPFKWSLLLGIIPWVNFFAMKANAFLQAYDHVWKKIYFSSVNSPKERDFKLISFIQIG